MREGHFNPAPEPLPRHSFNRAAAITKEEAELIADFFNASKNPGQLIAIHEQPNPERLRHEQLVLDHHIQMIQSWLGVDVSSRRLDLQRIRYYQPDEWMKIDPCANDTEAHTSGTHIWPYNEISILIQEESRMLGALSHELLHGLSAKTLHVSRLSRELKIKEYRLGFHLDNNKHGYKLFNEWLTEDFNIELLAHLQKTGLDIPFAMERHLAAYHEGILLFDLMVDAISRQTNTPYQMVKNTFRKDNLVGSVGSLRLLRDLCNHILTLSIAEADFDDVALIAHLIPIDSDSYASRRRAFQAGQPITLSSGITIYPQPEQMRKMSGPAPMPVSKKSFESLERWLDEALK